MQSVFGHIHKTIITIINDFCLLSQNVEFVKKKEKCTIVVDWLCPMQVN